MARREYKGAATPTTITSTITNVTTSITISDATNWPTGSFSFVIDPGVAGEEKVLASSRSGTTINVTTRGYDNTTAASHNVGAVIYPVPTAVDFDEANNLVSGITAGTGIAMAGSTSGSTLFKSSAVAGSTTITLPAATDTLVGKATSDTLTNKTLVAPIIATISNTGTLTLPTSSDTLVGKATTDILTNKTLTSPIITNAVNNQTGTTFTPALTDNNSEITLNNASAIAVTIPTNASVAFPIGSWIE